MANSVAAKPVHYVILGSNHQNQVMGFGTYHKGMAFAHREVAERAMKRLEDAYPTTHFFILDLVRLDDHL